MDIRKVKKLMELLEQSGMSEIEIKEGEESVKISRYGNTPLQPQSFIQQPLPTSQANAAPPSSTTEALSININSITSPMVGTYYSAPSNCQALCFNWSTG